MTDNLKGFAAQDYKHTDSYNGIDPSYYDPPPGVITMLSTMRAFWDSQAEVHVTCIYRWPQLPVAKFLGENSEDLGKRFRINSFTVPTQGEEEPFWQDAAHFFKEMSKIEPSASLEIEVTGIYLLISGVNPQGMLSARASFILLNINELSIPEVMGLFSKLFDMFSTEISFIRIITNINKKSPGKILLSSDNLSNEPKLIKRALQVLAEI